MLLPILVALAAPPDPPECVADAEPGPTSASSSHDPLIVSSPLFDLVQSRQGGVHFPTWSQAVSLSATEVELGHYALLRATEGLDPYYRFGLRLILVPLFDTVATLNLPGQAWAHEEGHRAVLGELGMASKNGVNDLGRDWPGGYIPVYGMSDDEIAAAKARSPAAWVRVQEAGWESEQARLLRIEKDTFALPTLGRINPVIAFMTKLNMLEYWNACMSYNPSDDELAENERDPRLRDFTGPDCTGWVYDLFRPGEPYANRGLHPSGEGLRRARRITDLTAQERSYLRQQRNLSLLNLIDPSLFGAPVLTLEDPLTHAESQWFGSVSYTVTSFGSATDVNLFMREGAVTSFVTLHGYLNHTRLFPGLTLELSRYPLPRGFSLSASCALWLQPRDQAFVTRLGTLGGAASVTLGVPLPGPFALTLNTGGKTEGWVATNPALAAAWDAEVGLEVAL